MKSTRYIIELIKKARLYARVGLKGMTSRKAYTMSRYWLLTNIFKRKIPWLIEFSVTYRCQCKCPHCSVGGYLNKGSKRDELTGGQIKDVLHQAAKMGIPKIDFFGGETLLKEGIIDLIRFGARLGIYMSLTTNGWLLTEELTKKLKGAGVSCINISLDSVSEERHDKLRGLPGLYQRVINGVRYCHEEGIPCVLSTYLTRSRIKNFGTGPSDNSQLTRLIALSKKLKASGLRVLFPISSGRWEGATAWEFTEVEKKLVIDNIDNSIAFIEGAFSVRNRKKVCQSLNGKMFNISPYGDVQICVTYPDVFGNVKDRPLADILTDMYKSTIYVKNKGGSCCSTTGLIR